MKTTRQAVMRVSRELFEAVLPDDRRPLHCVGDKPGESYEWLVEAMRLPADSRITGVSTTLYFLYDQVAVRVEHPSFVATMEGCQLPEVQAMYAHDEHGKAAFLMWFGPAVGHSSVGTQTTPDEIDRQLETLRKERERAWKNGVVPGVAIESAPPGGSWRDRPPLL